MIIELDDDQLKALRALKTGIAFFDNYEKDDRYVNDDMPIMAIGSDGDDLYEFALDEGQLKVGQLRDISSIEIGE